MDAAANLPKTEYDEGETDFLIDDINAIKELMAKNKEKKKGEVDVCQAVKEIRDEERQEGRAEGEDRAMALMQKLFAAGRIDDAKKASEDPEYKKQLLKEFALA